MERININKDKLRKNSLFISLVILLLGGILITIAFSINNSKTLFNYDNVLIKKGDSKATIRTLEENSRITILIKSDVLIEVNILRINENEQLQITNLTDVEKNLDTISRTLKEGLAVADIDDQGDYVFIFQNLNTTRSALVSQINCEIENSNNFEISSTNPFLFYSGILLSISAVIIFLCVELTT